MGILELQAKNRQKKRDRLNITYTSYQFYLLTEGPGFEPGLTDSKSAVLQLNYTAMNRETVEKTECIVWIQSIINTQPYRISYT